MSMTKPNIQYIAAKALIKNADGQVLLLKQSDSTISGHQKYHPPGGIVELGESVRESLARELQEELGVSSIVGELFDMGEWQAQRDNTVMQFVGLYFVCTVSSEDFLIQKSEASEAAWAGIDELDCIEILEPSKSIVLKFLQG